LKKIKKKEEFFFKIKFQIFSLSLNPNRSGSLSLSLNDVVIRFSLTRCADIELRQIKELKLQM
jgi:hypothetical protein